MNVVVPIDDLLDLTGRGAVVTGAARGIGLAIATRLAEAGAGVVLADADGEAAEASAAALRALGLHAQAATVDVRQAGAVEAMIDAACDFYGQLNILVANAGVYRPNALIQDLDDMQWDRMLDTNLRGAFLSARAAARRLIAEGRDGVILFTSSVSAFRPDEPGQAHYGASKAALQGLTLHLARELGPHGIRVLALAPGAIDISGTPAPGRPLSDAFEGRVPLGRIGVPDDVARVALFLCSQAAAYMTGTTVVVDGGYLAS